MEEACVFQHEGFVEIKYSCCAIYLFDNEREPIILVLKNGVFVEGRYADLQ